MRKFLLFMAFLFAGLVVAVSSTSCNKQKETAQDESVTQPGQTAQTTQATAEESKSTAATTATSAKKRSRAPGPSPEDNAVRHAILMHAAIMEMEDVAKRDQARRTLYADEYTYTGPDGRLFTRDELMARQRYNRVRIKVVDVEDLQVRSYGVTAVANYYALIVGSEKGFPYTSLRTRVTSFLVKRDGKWQIANDHLTLTAS